jgi:hypothetical protein
MLSLIIQLIHVWLGPRGGKHSEVLKWGLGSIWLGWGLGRGCTGGVGGIVVWGEEEPLDVDVV